MQRSPSDVNVLPDRRTACCSRHGPARSAVQRQIGEERVAAQARTNGVLRTSAGSGWATSPSAGPPTGEPPVTPARPTSTPRYPGDTHHLSEEVITCPTSRSSASVPVNGRSRRPRSAPRRGSCSRSSPTSSPLGWRGISGTSPTSSPTATRWRASRSTAATATTSCVTRALTCWRRRSRTSTRTRSSASARPIKDGFYYDFDVEIPFTPDDLAKIETRMRKIIKDNQRFSRRVTTDDDARVELADEPYKIELIGLKGGAADAAQEIAEGAEAEVGAGELTIYDNIDRNGEVAWKDLCRGPHLPTTKRIPAFKLMRSAAAYWRGDEKNKQLQRVYGTAWESKESLDDYLHRLEEAEKRDHRKLGPRARPLQLPRRDRLRPRGVPSQGWRDQAGDGGLRPPAAHRGGLPVRRHAPHHQGRPVPHLRAPARTSPTRCSRPWRWRARTTTSRR